MAGPRSLSSGTIIKNLAVVGFGVVVGGRVMGAGGKYVEGTDFGVGLGVVVVGRRVVVVVVRRVVVVVEGGRYVEGICAGLSSNLIAGFG